MAFPAGGLAVNKPGPVPSAVGDASAPVFVSYATADRKEAISVCKAIERRGVRCWISSRDVKPGENYQEAIVRSIRTSRAMVLVFSEAANNSDEIKKELSLASKHRVPVMALRIEDVEPSDAFAYELSTRQWIDAFEGWDKSVDALVATLTHAGLSDIAADQPMTRSGGRRAQIGGRTKTLIGATAGVALLCAGAAWLLLRPAGPVHSMQVRLTGFTRLSSDLPLTLPAALNDEIGAAFNTDGVIGVSTAAAPPQGSSPAYALGGTVAQDGDKVKVIVRLTDERTGTSLWSNSYSYDSPSLAHVARWAGVDVSQVVRCGLFGASTYPKALPDPLLSDYLQFCVHASPTKDMDIMHQIVAAVPDFSWGWSGLATATGAAAFGQKGAQRDDLLKQAIAAADRAIALDASNSEAFEIKSDLIDPSDLLGREALLKKAIAARALACGCEHHSYGSFLMQVGRIDDAMLEFDRSTDVLPLNGGSQFAAGKAMLIKGDPDAAAKRFDAVLDLASAPGLADNLIVVKAAITGKNAGADKAMQDPKFGVFSENVRANVDAFAALDAASPLLKARAISELNALNTDWISMPEVPLFGALGDNADAMKYLEADVRRGRAGAYEWLWYPTMDGVRRDPSFPALLQRLGLIHYWKTTHTRPDVCADKNAPPFCGML